MQKNKEIELSGLVDVALLNEVSIKSSVVSSVMPVLTNNRFDLAFKLLLSDNFSATQLTKFNVEAYLAHIKAFGLGKYKEPGNTNKNSSESFLSDFNTIFRDMYIDGFDAKKSVVPIANDCSILNGAHRTAAGISLGKHISVTKLDLEPVDYDYKYFLRRGVDDVYMDAAALKYAEYGVNTFLAIVWPSAKGFEDEIEQILGEIVYKKNVIFTDRGAHNVIAECYSGEPWLGDRAGGNAGVKGKYIECFKGNSDARCYLFECSSLEKVLKIKERVRELFKIGKHSIHITDTREECLALSRLVLNESGIQFLNYAETTKFAETENKINQFKQNITGVNGNLNDYVLDSGMVLEIFGIREANDVDCIAQEEVVGVRGVDFHDNKYHDLVDIFHTSASTFYYKGVRFVSLNKVREFKESRGELKDISDVASIRLLLSNKEKTDLGLIVKKKITFWLYRLFFKFRNSAIAVLKGIGLFSLVRSIYRKFK